MKIKAENEIFDIKLEPLDWRYSAAIVGLHKYLSFHHDEFELTDEEFRFKSEDITEEKYLKFVEHYYKNELYHIRIEAILSQENVSQEQISLINDLLKGNTIMNKTFGKVKCDLSTKETILQTLEDNKSRLTKETFRNKSNMYANYANTGFLFKGGGNCCRLLGYYVDGNRKGRAISYSFDTNTFVSVDNILFDFIPFAFYGVREAFFINDNYSLKRLIQTNRMLEVLVKDQAEETKEGNTDVRRILFETIKESADFIDFDVEVIVKNRENSYFETLYIRKASIDILKSMKTYGAFCFSLKINDNYYINVQKKVTECILNLVRLDELIELFLKRNDRSYLVSVLIDVNMKICGGKENMKKSMQGAYACAKEVVKKIPDNKISSYRQKLISSVVFKDYDRVCQVLLQLSNYSDVPFGFVYSLFEDFDANKDVAYTFINALSKDTSKEN